MQSNTLRMMSSHLRSVPPALIYIQDIYSIYGFHMMLRFAPVRQMERIYHCSARSRVRAHSNITDFCVLFEPYFCLELPIFEIPKKVQSGIQDFPKNNPGSRNRDRWSSRSSRNRAGAAASSSSACLNLRAEVDKLLCS